MRRPANGAAYIASKLDAIASNPKVWEKTVFILSYDENDGLFDHVVPPTPPKGTPDEFVVKTSNTGEVGNGWPVGLGFRVPCIVVSPWTVGGYVNSELSDHTSQLRLLEKVTGVAEPNISVWRRKTVGDLTSAFAFTTSRRPHGCRGPKEKWRWLTTRSPSTRCPSFQVSSNRCRAKSGIASARGVTPQQHARPVAWAAGRSSVGHPTSSAPSAV